MRPGHRPAPAFNAAGEPITTVYVRTVDPALRADPFGDGHGVYLDPAEAAAAQATAELLMRIRRAAGERVAMMTEARRHGARRPRAGGGS